MKRDWWSCDGTGKREGAETSSSPPQPRRLPPITLSRRQALLGTATALVGWMTRERTALAEVGVQPGRREPRGDVFVQIFLRGGADGLNIVIPYAEDEYHRRRPTLGLASPGDRRAGRADRALDLNGFFGLHPALAPLLPLYQNGLLAFVHACGSGDQTRSHFEAMATMERGQANDATGTASGWLARHLAATLSENASPLRAVAFTSVMPDILRGATDATALRSLEDFRLILPGATAARETELRRALMAFYAEGRDAVAEAGRETLAVLDTLNRLDPAHYRPANGALYPESDLGRGLKQVACLLRSRVGLEVAFLDKGGFDTHVAQGSAGGWLATLLDDLGRSLAAFAQDMGPEMRRVTVAVMTEFGRRLQENSGLGTDHGRASVMMLLGGGVYGGKVYGTWPGLRREQLEEEMDLRVTTDYRDVLSEIVVRRLHNDRLADVFPNYTPRSVGVVAGGGM